MDLLFAEKVYTDIEPLSYLCIFFCIESKHSFPVSHLNIVFGGLTNQMRLGIFHEEAGGFLSA